MPNQMGRRKVQFKKKEKRKPEPVSQTFPEASRKRKRVTIQKGLDKTAEEVYVLQVDGKTHAVYRTHDEAHRMVMLLDMQLELQEHLEKDLFKPMPMYSESRCF